MYNSVEFKDKYKNSCECIESAINRFKNIYVSWSGGKDSTAVLLMALEIKPDIKVLFIDNGDEHKEIYDYVKRVSKELSLNIETVTARKGFFQVLREYPIRKKRFGQTVPRCIYWFKEEPAKRFNKSFHADAMMLGIQSSEGSLKFRVVGRNGPVFFHKTLGLWKVCPIHNWSNKEVISFVESRIGRVAELYYDGIHKRSGCLHCFQYLNWHKHMKRAHPVELKKLLKELDKLGYYVKKNAILKKPENSIDSYNKGNSKL